MDISLLVYLHIAAGPAEQFLFSLGAQTSVWVGWSPVAVDPLLNFNLPAMNGLYLVADAWCVALKGTGLIWRGEMFGDRRHDRYIVLIPARPGEYEALCQPRIGWGPEFIQPPQADWQ